MTAFSQQIGDRGIRQTYRGEASHKAKKKALRFMSRRGEYTGEYWNKMKEHEERALRAPRRCDPPERHAKITYQNSVERRVVAPKTEERRVGKACVSPVISGGGPDK